MAPAHAQYELVAQVKDELVTRTHLGPGTYVVGRDRTCDVMILRDSLSRKHARITLRGNEWLVEDLGSRNGTLVNGHELTALTPFKPSDVLLLGDVEIRVTKRSTAPSTLPPAYLILQNTKERGAIFELKGNAITVGRGKGNDIRLDDPSVSREHAIIRGLPEEECWCVEDLESANGTFVDGITTHRAHLQGGEIVHFGAIEFLFQSRKAPTSRSSRLALVLLVAGLVAALALMVVSFGLAD